MHYRHKRELNLTPSGKKQVYHVRFRVAQPGKRAREINRSTGQIDEKLARDIGWQIYLEETQQAGRTIEPLRNTYCTIGDITKAYEANIVLESKGKTSHTTAVRNSQALMRLLKLGCDCEDPKQLRATVLTETTLDAWRAARYRNDGLDYLKDINLRLNYALNSEYTAAKSVFSKNGIKIYKKLGLKLPELDGFCLSGHLKDEAPKFEKIPADILDKMDAAAVKMKEIRPRIAVVYEMARFAGMRSDEIQNCRAHWFVFDGDKCKLDIRYRDPRTEPEEYHPKASPRRVPVDPDRVKGWFDLLGIIPGSQTLLIDGRTVTERREIVERETNGLIAAFLPDRKKRLHELRKQAGTEVSERAGNPIAGALFLGDSIQVAINHYLDSGGLMAVDPL